MADDVLVVASKVRKYIKENAGCNTSAETYEALSDVIRTLCDKAVNVAKDEKRKTVMARDVQVAFSSDSSGSSF